MTIETIEGRERERVRVIAATEEHAERLSSTLVNAGYSVQRSLFTTDFVLPSAAELGDLVVIRMMPDHGNGSCICDLLKHSAILSHLPVMLVSERILDDDEIVKVLNCGVDGIIAEPYSTREFLARVESLMRLRRAERRAAEERNRLETLLETLPIPIFIKNVDGRYTGCNKKFLEFLGKTRDEVMGRTVYEIAPAELAKRYDEMDHALFESGGAQEYEWKVRASQGDRDVIFHKAALKNERGEITGLIGGITDVTEQTLYQRELLEQKKKLETYTDALQHPFYVINAKNYEIEFANTSALRGRRSGRWTCHELSHESATPCASDNDPCPLEIVTRTRKPAVVEHTHFKSDGSPIKVEIRAYPIFGADGEVEKMIEYTIDVTDRKKAEAALKESEERYRALTDALPDTIFLLDWDGKYHFINKTGAAVLGKKPEELVGKTLAAVFPEKTVRAYLANIRKVISTGQPLSEENLLVNTPFPVWMDVRLIPIRNDADDVYRVLGIARNISDRKNAEESKRKLLRAVEQASAAIVITDAHGVIEYANPHAAASTGYTPEELIGQNPRVLKSGHTSSAGYNELWKTISAGNDWTGEFHNRRKDGTYYWERAVISPIRDESGKITHYVAVKDDITDEKRMEEERFAAIEKDAMLGRLAATVAHEVNNPLFAIKMQTESLAKSLVTDAAKSEKLKLIREQVDRIGRTVKALLGLARKPAAGVGEADLAEMLRGVLLLYEVGFVSKGIEVTLNIPSKLPLVHVHGDRIQQVFINILENARQALEEGGKIRITLAVSNGTYSICIEDSGPGLGSDPEKVFEPHYTTKEQGTGLGLAITKRIVLEHGGTITAENRSESEGGGARFVIALPLV